jgi:hypothetical protein
MLKWEAVPALRGPALLDEGHGQRRSKSVSSSRRVYRLYAKGWDVLRAFVVSDECALGSQLEDHIARSGSQQVLRGLMGRQISVWRLPQYCPRFRFVWG